MKGWKLVVLSILVVVAVLTVGKNVILKAAIENGAKAVTGLPLSMDKFNLSILKTIIDIEGLVVSNPKGFEEKTMVSIPTIYLDYDLPSAFKGVQHVESIKIHLGQFIVVKNKDGEVNLDHLKALQQPAGEKKEKPAPDKKEKGEMPKIQIDEFELVVGEVIYKDYTKGDEPSVKKFNININETFTNVTDPNDLVKIIVVKALMGTTIGNLVGFDVSALTGELGDTLASGKEMAAKMAGDAKAKLAEAANSIDTDKLAADAKKQADEMASKAKDAMGDTASALGDKTKDLAGGLTDKIKNPFGKSN